MVEVIYSDRTNPTYLIVEIREDGLLKSFRVPKTNHDTIASQGQSELDRWLRKMALAAQILGKLELVEEIDF